MNRRNFSLQIPKPCHENWHEMTMVEKGRFCQSCQKTVIDFTRMNEEEIQQLLAQASGKVCGRFRVNQLQRSARHSSNASIPKWQMYMWAISTMVGLKAIAGETVKAQVALEQGEPTYPDLKKLEFKESLPTSAPVKDSTYTITGRVVGEDTLPVPGVSVLLKGTTLGTTTDMEGNYTFTISQSIDAPPVLVFSFIGYVTQEIVLNGKKQCDAVMEADIKGGLSVCPKYKFPKNILMFPVRAYRQVKGLFYRLIHT